MPALVEWGRREYVDSLGAMRSMVTDRRAGRIGDTLILVEHFPVVTVGVEGDDGSAAASGLPVVPVERGGRATYHGPGQLVGYPIVDLDGRGRDVRRFVRDLEELVGRAVATYGIEAGHVSGRPGVWVGGSRKIASIGIAVREWVSFHGFALNVEVDLNEFQRLRPCGFDGSVMTSISREVGHRVALPDVVPAVRAAWEGTFGGPFRPLPRPGSEALRPEVGAPA
jgi:lipoyl(octanoyl) transferase